MTSPPPATDDGDPDPMTPTDPDPMTPWIRVPPRFFRSPCPDTPTRSRDVAGDPEAPDHTSTTRPPNLTGLSLSQGEVDSRPY